MGSGNLLRCAQERLQGRSTLAIEYRAAGTGSGAVHDHRLACPDAHVSGPDMDCEVIFERDEWQAAYIVARKPIPKQPPSLNTVVRLIASFGGFLGRKGDGEPGVKTIWTGLQRVMDFAAEIRAYKAGEICV